MERSWPHVLGGFSLVPPSLRWEQRTYQAWTDQPCSVSRWSSLAALSGDPGQGDQRQSRWRRHDDHGYSAGAGRENEEVVPVNVSTWVLLLGVTVGR